MKTYQQAYEFLLRLPLLTGVIKPNEYEFLFYKWGGKDGTWHSVKSAIKDTGLQLSLEDGKMIEKRGIEELEAIISSLYICPSCYKDLRKNGISRSMSGFRRERCFLSENGQVSRVTDESFMNESFKDIPKCSYECINCGIKLKDKDPLTRVLNEGGITQRSIKKLLEALKEHPDFENNKRKINKSGKLSGYRIPRSGFEDMLGEIDHYESVIAGEFEPAQGLEHYGYIPSNDHGGGGGGGSGAEVDDTPRINVPRGVDIS